MHQASKQNSVCVFFQEKEKKTEEIATFLLKTSQALTGERKKGRRKEREFPAELE